MNISELHVKFVEYGHNAKEWLRKCALLLPEIEKFEVWREKGFNSIYEYAAKLACMSRGQVEEALYICKKIADKPALKKIAEIKGIHAVRPVLSMATESNQEFWAEKAKNMSQQTLKTYVRDFKQQTLQTPRVNPNTQLETKTITMQLKPETATKLEKLNNDNWNELMEKLIGFYEKDLEESKPPVKENARRTIPLNIKKYVLKRCNGKCEFPNCQQKYTNLHHTNRYGSQKTHDPDQIIALCKAHHDLAHRGLIDNEEQAPQKWQIRKEANINNLNWFIDEQVQVHRRI